MMNEGIKCTNVRVSDEDWGEIDGCSFAKEVINSSQCPSLIALVLKAFNGVIKLRINRNALTECEPAY